MQPPVFFSDLGLVAIFLVTFSHCGLCNNLSRCALFYQREVALRASFSMPKQGKEAPVKLDLAPVPKKRTELAIN